MMRLWPCPVLRLRADGCTDRYTPEAASGGVFHIAAVGKTVDFPWAAMERVALKTISGQVRTVGILLH